MLLIYAEKVKGNDGQDWIKASFQYAPLIVNAIKDVPEALYIPDRRIWGIPYKYREEFENKMGDFLIKWKGETLPHNGGIDENEFPDQPIVPGYSVQYEGDNIISAEGFKTKPFGKFQVRGFNAIVSLDYLILADDAGLGKSWETVTAIEAKKKLGQLQRGVILCKASLLFNWRDEIQKHSYLKWVVVAGTKAKRYQIYNWLRNHKDEWDVVIISYDTYRVDSANIAHLDNMVSLDYMILDEAHVIKNPNSKIGTLAHRIPVKYKYLLTATPFPNTPLEVYNYLKLGGKVDTNWWVFRNHHSIFGGYGNKEIVGLKNMSEVTSKVKKYMLRRLKKDKLKELPDVVFKTIRLPMTNKQQVLYHSIKEEIYEDLKNLEVSSIHLAITKLLRLQQVTNSIELVGAPACKDSSSKLLALDDLLEDLISAGEKVIIFSRFKSMTDIIRNRYKKYNPAWIDGSVKVAGGERQQQVYKFQQNDSCNLFVGCTPACREGQTLTAASHVFFTDLEWAWDYVEQAFSRAHRIGQMFAVNVNFLVCENTVDECVLNIVMQKRDLKSSVVGDGSSNSIIKDIIMSLLEG